MSDWDRCVELPKPPSYGPAEDDTPPAWPYLLAGLIATVVALLLWFC